jgi:ketosteroid isomerase-like protein
MWEFCGMYRTAEGLQIAIERIRARRVGSGETVEMALRVTTVFRLEEDGWRICLRHADRFTTPQRREDSGT